MDNSSVSTLTPPPPNFTDVDDIQMEDSGTSSASASASTSSSLPLGRQSSRPQVSSTRFIGHSFKSGGVKYTVREKSAVRRGGRKSYIWIYSLELSSLKHRFTSWLYNSCWDKETAVIRSGGNIIRPARHLLEKYNILNTGERIEDTIESEIEQTAFIIKSVL
jgi:hypothetical protein